MKGKTSGLCGTYNSDSTDDFKTPDESIETSVALFANKWKTEGSCSDQKDLVDPCIQNPERKEMAEKTCNHIKESVFANCHSKVDYETFYNDCLFDVCACKNEVLSKCACPIMSQYAAECSLKGVNLNWQEKIEGCAVKCPIGQIFSQCGDACARTCSDISRETPCKYVLIIMIKLKKILIICFTCLD